MIEPNFGEGQLQQFANDEILRYIYQNKGYEAVPIIPTPHKENDLGFDTSMYLPWLKGTLNDGSNLFIQYKRSFLWGHGRRGKRPRYWNDWNQREYMQFPLYHIKESKKDYTQRDYLSDLSVEGYLVVYITNHTVVLNELIKSYRQHTLLDEAPILRVHSYIKDHSEVTHTRNDRYFQLFSVPEKSEKYSLKYILDNAPKSDLVEDITRLQKWLFTHGIKVPEEHLYINEGYLKAAAPETDIIRFLIVQDVLYFFFGIQWIRF